MVISTIASSDFSPGFPLDFAFRLIAVVTVDVATDQVRPPLFHRLLSQHPALPTPEGSSRLLSRLFTASMAFVVVEQLGSLLFPFGLTFRRCKIHFVLRAAVLHSLLGRILRFSTSGHPEALGACYVASWRYHDQTSTG